MEIVEARRVQVVELVEERPGAARELCGQVLRRAAADAESVDIRLGTLGDDAELLGALAVARACLLAGE